MPKNFDNQIGRIAVAPLLRYFSDTNEAPRKRFGAALLKQGRKWAAKLHPLFIFVALIEYLHLVFIAIPGDAFEEDVGKVDERKFRIFADWSVNYMQAALILLGAKRFADPVEVEKILEEANVLSFVSYKFDKSTRSKASKPKS